MRIQTVRFHYSVENFLVPSIRFYTEIIAIPHYSAIFQLTLYYKIQIVQFQIAHKIFWMDFLTIRGPPVLWLKIYFCLNIEI